MSEEELALCLKIMEAQEKVYEKNAIILHAGTLTDRMGLVLSGGVTIESNDVWGNCTILNHVGPGSFFAETYAMLPDEVMLVDVRTSRDSRILFLKIGGLFMRPPEPSGRPGSPEQAHGQSVGQGGRASENDDRLHHGKRLRRAQRDPFGGLGAAGGLPQPGTDQHVQGTGPYAAGGDFNLQEKPFCPARVNHSGALCRGTIPNDSA